MPCCLDAFVLSCRLSVTRTRPAPPPSALRRKYCYGLAALGGALRPLRALASMDVDIPDEWRTDGLGPLNDLTRLRSLTFRSLPWSTTLEDMGPLLGRLTALHLPRRQGLCPGNVAAVAHATRLRVLELTRCHNALAHVSQLTRLTRLAADLHMYACLMKYAESLGQCRSLVSLELRGCESVLSLDPLQPLTQLRSLRLQVGARASCIVQHQKNTTDSTYIKIFAQRPGCTARWTAGLIWCLMKVLMPGRVVLCKRGACP